MELFLAGLLFGFGWYVGKYIVESIDEVLQCIMRNIVRRKKGGKKITYKRYRETKIGF